MRRWNLYFALTLTLLVGAWGCSRNTNAPTGLTERIQSLEAKTVRLEEDFRSASIQRDQFRKKLAVEEEARALLQTEVERLNGVVRDYNEIKTQLAQRTTERDQLITQYDVFRKNLRDMLGQADLTLNALKQPTAPVISTAGIKEVAPIQTIAPTVVEGKQKSGL